MAGRHRVVPARFVSGRGAMLPGRCRVLALTPAYFRFVSITIVKAIRKRNVAVTMRPMNAAVLSPFSSSDIAWLPVESYVS